MTLSVEQMEFLAARGLSLADVIEFAKLAEKPRSKGAERVAKWRERKAGGATPETVTKNVTRNVTRNASPPPIDNIHTPPVSSNDETIPPEKSKRAGLPAKPEGVSDQTWRDFTAMRKRKRADLSETALAGIKREAEKAGWGLDAALAETVARGWQAFKADWVTTATGTAAPVDAMMAGFIARQARQPEEQPQC